MLLLYAYCVGIVSSRKIERACYEDLDGLENPLAEVVLLQQLPERQDRRLIGTSIKTSSIVGSLSEYYCCIRWIRSMVASG